MADGARLLAVGRLRKPHGLKGECAVFPLTAEPAERLAREVRPGDVVLVMGGGGSSRIGHRLLELLRIPRS